jgi:hypothetical protein
MKSCVVGQGIVTALARSAHPLSPLLVHRDKLICNRLLWVMAGITERNSVCADYRPSASPTRTIASGNLNIKNVAAWVRMLDRWNSFVNEPPVKLLMFLKVSSPDSTQ